MGGGSGEPVVQVQKEWPGDLKTVSVMFPVSFHSAIMVV